MKKKACIASQNNCLVTKFQDYCCFIKGIRAVIANTDKRIHTSNTAYNQHKITIHKFSWHTVLWKKCPGYQTYLNDT